MQVSALGGIRSGRSAEAQKAGPYTRTHLPAQRALIDTRGYDQRRHALETRSLPRHQQLDVARHSILTHTTLHPVLPQLQAHLAAVGYVHACNGTFLVSVTHACILASVELSW